MSILQMAAELFLRQTGSAGGGLDLQSVMGALQKLLPSSGGELDIAQLVTMFAKQGGIASMASSWLSDGDNQSISASQVIGVLGQGQIAEFAQKLGLGTDTAAQGLAGIIPELIDKNSKSGTLLSGAAGNILGKLF